MTPDVTKHLERAKRCLEKNRVEDAIEAYQAVLEAAPTHQEAMQALGDLYARLDQPERAATYYGKLFDRLTDPRDDLKAIALYTRFLKLVPQPPERVARYALLLQKQNRPEEAIEQYQLATEQFTAQGRGDAALACQERLAQLDPNNGARHFAQGELAERQGKPLIAARGFLRAGQLALAAGELDRALELFARAHQLAPTERGVALVYAQARLRQGTALGDAAALKLLERFSTSESDSTYLETFGEALMRAGQLVRARGVLEQFYKEKAGSYEKLFDLADRCLKAKQDDQAIQILTSVKKRMLDSRRESEFAAQLDRLAEANPSSLRLFEFWGALYNELNREAKYFDVLIRLFDLHLEAGNPSAACKAIERLQKIAEMFPGEEEHNERLRSLYQMAHWSPAGSKIRAEAARASSSSGGITGKTGTYSVETLRDLSKISEINQTVYRQATPRAMLSVAVNEVGTYLRVVRCLAVVGAPGQPPQMAAEFCAPGVEASAGSLIVRLLGHLERAAPDSLGGLPLEAAAAPVLREMGLETAVGGPLTGRETQAPAGMLVAGCAAPHKWKPNETYFLQAVGDQMLLSLHHTRLRTLVRTLAVADEKTGLLARSSYTDCLLGETQRAKSQGTPLAVALLQIDRGSELIHQQGEAQVENHMEQLARVLQPVVRQNDLAVKYNAWSLAFILPDTTLAGARSLAEKLRKVAVGVRPPWDGAQLTLSAGVAEAIARPDYDSEDIVTDLINRAEFGLEDARKMGGGTIVSPEIPGAEKQHVPN